MALILFRFKTFSYFLFISLQRARKKVKESNTKSVCLFVLLTTKTSFVSWYAYDMKVKALPCLGLASHILRQLLAWQTMPKVYRLSLLPHMHGKQWFHSDGWCLVPDVKRAASVKIQSSGTFSTVIRLNSCPLATYAWDGPIFSESLSTFIYGRHFLGREFFLFECIFSLPGLKRPLWRVQAKNGCWSIAKKGLEHNNLTDEISAEKKSLKRHLLWIV